MRLGLILLATLTTACGSEGNSQKDTASDPITNWELVRTLVMFTASLPTGADDTPLTCVGGGTDTRTSKDGGALNALAACRLIESYSDGHTPWFDLTINGEVVFVTTDFSTTHRLSVGAADPLRINGWISRDGSARVALTDRTCAFSVDVDASVDGKLLPLAGIACDEPLGTRTEWK